MKTVFLLFAITCTATLHGAGYNVETIPGPPGVTLEVGCMDFTPNGTLMVGTRWGEIWALKDGKWSPFASGLHEPLGLVATGDREVCVLQRPELTRISSTKKEGPADHFECISDGWHLNGMETEYSYGLVRDKDGNFFGTLATNWDSSMKSLYRGWSFRVSPSGEFTPWSSGLRNANGIVISPDGELFCTDNQGEWLGTSPLNHIRRGDFHGFAFDIQKYEQFKNVKLIPEELIKVRKPPAIQFPYANIARSPGQPAFDVTGGEFGPFTGQMFIPDQIMTKLMRVALEKVDGAYQGACFPFLEDWVTRGGHRAVFAPDGSLWIGQTVRGWYGTGSEGLQRISWTGTVPLEIQSISLTTDGFDLDMTLPVTSERALNKLNYAVRHFRYLYQATYGSPEVDSVAVAVKEVKLSSDNKRISLTLPKLEAGCIYEIRTIQFSKSGLFLENQRAYYTVNKLRPK